MIESFLLFLLIEHQFITPICLKLSMLRIFSKVVHTKKAILEGDLFLNLLFQGRECSAAGLRT